MVVIERTQVAVVVRYSCLFFGGWGGFLSVTSLMCLVHEPAAYYLHRTRPVYW